MLTAEKYIYYYIPSETHWESQQTPNYVQHPTVTTDTITMKKNGRKGDC